MCIAAEGNPMGSVTEKNPKKSTAESPIPDTAALSDLFYRDRNAYEQLYIQRTESAHTVRINFEINGNTAFFERTPESNDTLAAILRANGEVEVLCCKLPKAALEQFARRCLIDEIVLNNGIEGVRSTRREIDELLDEASRPGRGKRFLGLVRKYLMLNTGEEIPLQTCGDIRAVYDDLVLEEIRTEEPDNLPDGQFFRKNDVTVYSASLKPIHQGVTPESRIITLMENALQFLWTGSGDMLCRIAVFHYLLEYIHPFYDGNGRLGRFICSYLLSRELCPLIGYRISYTIQEHIRAYYHAFSVCNDTRSRGDLTPFLEMFMTILRLSMEKLRESLRDGYMRLNVCADLIPRLPNGEETKIRALYHILIQAALFSEYGVSTKEILYHLGINRDTLRRRLGKIPPELLVTTTRKNEKYYSLDIDRIEEFSRQGGKEAAP